MCEQHEPGCVCVCSGLGPVLAELNLCSIWSDIYHCPKLLQE